MAAGPKQLAKDYIDMLKEFEKDLETMNQGFDYASAWDYIEFNNYKELVSYMTSIEFEIEKTINILKMIRDIAPEGTVEELEKKLISEVN